MTLSTWLFHASPNPIDRFCDSLQGQGWEANSTLGTWFSTCPHVAADHAPQGHLHILTTDTLRLAALRCHRSAIWGGPHLLSTDQEIARPRFHALRNHLLSKGFDGVWCEMPGTDLEGAVCLFSVARLRLVERHPLPNARLCESFEEVDQNLTVCFQEDLESRFFHL